MIKGVAVNTFLKRVCFCFDQDLKFHHVDSIQDSVLFVFDLFELLERDQGDHLSEEFVGDAGEVEWEKKDLVDVIHEKLQSFFD